MRIAYIFPHPDDESFGPAAVMPRQRREGHEVHLLTLTRGGATKVRHELKLSVQEMGEVRLEEMRAVERELDLSSMTVWDFEDSGLKLLDPRELERAVADYLRELRPDVVVTYAVHGVSGFHDHLVTHAVVKRVYIELREEGVPLRRLALLTVPDSGEATFIDGRIRLKHSTPEELTCSIPLTDEDVDAMRRALACYGTYRQTIADSGVVEKVGKELHFELFGEAPAGALSSLTADLA